KIFLRRILFQSISFALIPMIPMILYDFSHGFAQTIKFPIWILYQPFHVLGFPAFHSDIIPYSWSEFLLFIFPKVQQLIFLPNGTISVVLFFAGVVALLYQSIKTKYVSFFLLSIVYFLCLVGFIAE